MKTYKCKKCGETFKCEDMENFSYCPECDTMTKEQKELWGGFI